MLGACLLLDDDTMRGATLRTVRDSPRERCAALGLIGPRTGSRLLAEIGVGSRFASGSRLASYAGLAPVTRQSGSSLRGEARSRRGNHRLKNVMFLAAFASLRDPDSRAFYDRKRAEGKRHNAAVICLARRAM